MLKRSLTHTNSYLSNPSKRREMFKMTLSTSTDIDGGQTYPVRSDWQDTASHYCFPWICTVLSITALNNSAIGS